MLVRASLESLSNSSLWNLYIIISDRRGRGIQIILLLPCCCLVVVLSEYQKLNKDN